MANILVLIFCVLDSKVWDPGRLKSVIDQLLLSVTNPRAWLVKLSESGSDIERLEVLRSAMREFGISLPGNVGDLLAGLILYRFDSNGLTVEDARAELVDIIDAYGATRIDPEAALMLDLNDPVFSSFRVSATKLLEYLSSGHLTLADTLLIEA